MSEENSADPKAGKSGKGGLLLAMLLALAGAGGGFYAVHSGLLFPAPQTAVTHKPATDTALTADGPAPAFVPLQPLSVTLGRGSSLEQLRFEGYLDVNPGTEEAVAMVMPRIMDVLNGYLRAVEIGDLSDPSALMTLRAQLLRRIQVVVGGGKVNDLLISKFLLS